MDRYDKAEYDLVLSQFYGDLNNMIISMEDSIKTYRVAFFRTKNTRCLHRIIRYRGLLKTAENELRSKKE